MLGSRRIQAIDGFRGIAILMVLSYHYLVRWSFPLDEANREHLSHVYSPILAAGTYGVELFFIISGLVITRTLGSCGSAGEFVVKRLARIYPALFAASLLIFTALQIYNPARFPVGAAELFATFTLYGAAFRQTYVDGAFWSLVVESVFYAWTALFFHVLGKDFWKGLIGLGLAGAVAAEVNPGAAQFLLIASFTPFFLLGISISMGILERRREALAPAIAAALLYLHYAMKAPGGGLEWWLPHLALLPAAAFLILILVWNVEMPWGPISWIGRISYSLYLVHQNLGVTIIRIVKDAGGADWIAIGAALACAISLATAMFFLVEEPGRRLVMRLYERRPGKPLAGIPGAANLA